VDPVYLQPTAFVDSDHPSVESWARIHGVGESPRERAISLYYAIRDGFGYSPWGVALAPEAYRASGVIDRARAHCVDKANLLAACARALGVPSRLHFADVRNHLGTSDLERCLGTDLLVFHGYCELWLGGRWVAATPAFDAALCERLGVAPLDFDGRTDSVFQANPVDGRRFIEYVNDRGTFPDLPFAEMVAAWHAHYPIVRALGAWPRHPRG
jgi:transglutaminase-like putative cysteine protease